MTRNSASPAPRKGEGMPDVGNLSREVGGLGRGEMNDQRLADALDIGVADAHARIEDVTEHRTIDLSEED